ncbi:MAG: ABC transporter permease [Cytophagales bacterium]|nr:ABC transporter permease [Cytophagales bacterium]
MNNEKTVKESEWDLVIKPSRSLLDIPWADIWRYRDLWRMFVKRDVITVYKQTILGPVWYVLQPILTTLVFLLVFGRIAGLSTDGVPQVLFYLSGIIIWNYFSESFMSTSKTFIENAQIFGKVYFPRLILPLAKVTSGLIKFLIQFILFFCVWMYFVVGTNTLHPNLYALLTPLYVLIMAGLGLGFGIIFTSLTTKYRDLTFLLQFGIQLLMYATPVIYPVSSVPGKYKPFILANPITSIIEGFKYGFLGKGEFSWSYLAYSIAFTVVMMYLGVIIFNRTERSFIDTV